MQSGSTVQGYRLSPQQRRLASLLLSGGGHSAARPRGFVSQALLSLPADCDPALLRRALSLVCSRHEVLRTRFERLPSVRLPVQVIEPRPRLTWDELSGALPAHELMRRERERLGGGFDGGVSALLVTRDGEQWLIVSVGALAADAPTMRLIADELAAEYARLSGAGVGFGAEAGDEVAQYADISEVLNELLEGDEAGEGREYWARQREELAGNGELRLGWERRGGEPAGVVERDVEVFGEELGEEATRGLRGFAEQCGAGAEAVLCAAWAGLLWALSRSPGFTLGVKFGGRNYEDLETALGLYDRWLPVSLRLNEGSDFASLVSALAERMRDAGRWQETFPYDETEAAQHTNAANLFSVGFDYERLPADRAPGAFSVLQVYSRHEDFTLRLSLKEAGESLRAEFHYDPALYADGDIRRLAKLFRTFLRSALAEPGARLGRLEMLEDHERRRLITDFNQTAAAYERGVCLHELFARQAAQTPDLAAVVYEGEQLTFAELNVKAGRLAHRLRRAGAGPDSRVALCLDRSIDFVVGLLGVLKAGGAYVPLDPEMPPKRLLMMVEDAEARVVITEERLRERFAEAGLGVLPVEAEGDAAEEEGDPNVPVAPSNLAYVIYTSGSTGRPKGVAVEHRQLVNYLRGIGEKLELAEGDGFALVSTFAADLGHTVLFPSLCGGGTLHIISQERASNPARLADYFSRERIDCLKIVPSHLSALLDSARPQDVLPRKRLVLGGEASSWPLIERVRALAPGCRIINHYGPTETTVGVLSSPVVVTPEVMSYAATAPVGRPLGNTQAYVVDEWMRPVPPLVAGELLIGGEGVARGYLGRPDLTAERFIPDPFGAPGARLYRTGDVARYLPDGAVEFLGRRDHQVKVRGYRIEFGEIEESVRQFPAVREAVVATRPDAAGGLRLAAYVSARRGQTLDVNGLRDFLHERLPHYMIPSAFVVLDALPLTPNGKIDRQNLPDPDLRREEAARAYIPPASDAEKAVVAAWQEVLCVEQIGLYDNFFDLGGHSLFMIQVHSKLTEKFRRDIPILDLFKYTTASALAKYLSSEPGETRRETSEGQSRGDNRRNSIRRQSQHWQLS